MAVSVIKSMQRINSEGKGFSSLSECSPGTDMSTVVRMLEDRIAALEAKATIDEVLCAKYPALQELYNEYDTMKTLIAAYE